MNFEHLVQSTMTNEGFSPTVYLDTEGRQTVGYGLCVDPDVAGAGITREEAESILRMRLMRLQNEVSSAVVAFYELPDPVQQALVEMAYQLGVGGLLRFKKMLAAIEARDFQTAADEGMDSLWARQTPNRAEKVTGLIRSVAT